MSRAWCWAMLVVLSATFVRGLLAWIELSPLLGIAVGAMVVYTLISLAKEASDL